MKFTISSIPLRAGLTPRTVTIEESFKALKRKGAQGLPTSVFPVKVRRRLEAGEQVDLSELVEAPRAASLE